MTSLFDQAVGLHNQGRLEEAVRLYRRLLADDPRNAVTLINLGHALGAQRQFAPALAAYDQALALDANYVPLHFIRGDTLQALLRYDEALEAYNRFLGHAPGDAGAWTSRGLALQSLGRLDEALESFSHAEALDPLLAVAHLNHGLCHMLMGDFARGLPLYEWRKRMPQPMEARDYPQPLWTGAEDLNGKILFTYVEQGLGDTIQFYCYVSFALARGARVILSVPDQLIALLKNATSAVELLGWGEVPQQFDFHIPLASIPLAVGMRADTIPTSDHYLTAEPDRVARWKARLGSHGFRIGIAWQGKEQVMGLEGKSFPLAALAKIAGLPDVRLISLQKGEGVEQLAHLPAGMAVETHDFDDGPDAFLDTAAMMQACDLVITADTAPAHLAGALGLPAWVALKHVPDWRWFLGRDDSPWYPSLRLFRQRATGDWDSVFDSMADAISRRS
jgi:tetratricopeptide (TPR) repeat protein